MQRKTSGFTIVELLIVIVVIAILAAIVIVAYNGVQTRARDSKIEGDLLQLEQAIRAARVNRNDATLHDITGSFGTAAGCVYTPSADDISQRNAATETCWSEYENTLDSISNASEINVRGMKDPWGRPYYIDENEGEGSACGWNDRLGVFERPRMYEQWTITHEKLIPRVTPAC